MANISTLYRALQPAFVDAETIANEYPAMVALAREILGVYANCYSLLEIWPIGFRTYNLMVPNFTNVPFSLFGMGPPKDLLGLAMYEASRTAACSYCTAHSCTFALRRGTRTQDIVGDRSEKAMAVARFAEGLSRVPGDLQTDDFANLRRFVSEKDTEWLALAVSMMGFLNKFMDATGTELEDGIVSDIGSLLAPTGWQAGKHRDGSAFVSREPPPVDGLGTYLRILRMAPAAIRQEARWTRGIPASWPQTGGFLEVHTGCGFSFLSKLTHKRATRALTTILRDNLDAASSACGLAVKPMAAMVYATVVDDRELQQAARQLAKRHCEDAVDFEALAEFAVQSGSPEASLASLQERMSLSPSHACCLLLVRAVAPSPATPAADIVQRVSDTLAPAEIVEIMVWISVLQVLHRLIVYFAIVDSRAKV